MDEVVEGLRSGDADAFERFVQEYGDRIYRFVRRHVGERWAEDVTQEVFLRIHRSAAGFRPGGSFNAWVFTVANNLCLDFHRGRRKPPRLAPETEIASGDPVAPVEAAEVREAILKAVERLPLEQRQVFLMREEAGLSFREIAEIMKCPLNTALGRMHYALANLRKELAAFRE